MGRWHLGAAGLAAVLALPVTVAKAEHAFLCEGGRIVYASDATLDKLKREDPCIAAYHGLPPPGPVPARAAVTAGVAAPIAAVTASGAEGGSAGSRAGGPEPGLQLRPSSASEVVRHSRPASRRRFHEVNAEAGSAASRSASPQPIKVLNAGTAD